MEELGAFFKAFAQLVYYKLTHPSEERWRAVAVCLGLSATFWFLRAMGHNTKYIIPFDVKVKYDKKKYFIMGNPVQECKASVTGRGWTLAGVWSSLHTRPITYKPQVKKGYFKFRPTLLQENLESRFSNIKVNYIVVPLDSFQVDTMINRTIQVVFDSGQGSTFQKALGICYFGPSSQLHHFPNCIDVSKLEKGRRTKVGGAFPPVWQAYICSGQRGQLLTNLLHP